VKDKEEERVQRTKDTKKILEEHKRKKEQE
jgi:hypothetical protein